MKLFSATLSLFGITVIIYGLGLFFGFDFTFFGIMNSILAFFGVAFILKKTVD